MTPGRENAPFHRYTTVLLAEEDDQVRERLADVLSHEGYRVVAVEDGLELLDYLKLALSSKGHVPVPDVIVSDAQLAGCGGLSACKTVHATCPSTPFVLLAPCDDDRSLREAAAAGVDDIVIKPVDADELRDAVFLLAA
jgi:two-component system response regulator MprA